MLRLYRLLLHLYPPDYFDQFAEEMAAVFQQAQRDFHYRGFAARVSFYFREMLGVIAGALREQVSNHDCSAVRRISMRSFRFPRSTIFLMLMVLIGVVIAIEKARSLSIQLATGSTNVQAEWWALPGFFMMLTALMCGGGVIGYGLLFVLRRTTQRSRGVDGRARMI